MGHNITPEQIAARDNTVAEIRDADLNPTQQDLYYAAGVSVALIGEATGDQAIDEINVARLRLITLIGTAEAVDMSGVLAEASYLLMLLQGGAAPAASAAAPDPLQGVLSQPATQSQPAATTPDPAQQQPAPTTDPRKARKDHRRGRSGGRSGVLPN